ncbi:endogenous inhibitor of DNA gyrase (YacG/DUF329 family) [Arthrobacter sp. UYCu511]|uniref:hypothetical protein n=1 Tax=Arthrobacter sp. UYCu511 TaxID=3156337 RepID=UPI0033980591
MIQGLFARKCGKCGRGMREGYLADYEYYCSDACLRIDFTDEEWAELASDESDDFYYTDWSDWDDSTDELYTADGRVVTVMLS